jgi:large subunit ribosomal protein L10
MARPEKEKLVDELSEKLSQRNFTILADYTGISVQAVTKLRSDFRQESIEYRIYKNTLARLAAKKSDLEPLLEHLEGPTGYVFSEDPVAPAKILTDFIKDNPSMKIKCAILRGQLIDESQVKAIASLPPREILLGQLAGQLNSPATSLVNVLAAPIRKLAYALEDLRKKKEAA